MSSCSQPLNSLLWFRDGSTWDENLKTTAAENIEVFKLYKFAISESLMRQWMFFLWGVFMFLIYDRWFVESSPSRNGRGPCVGLLLQIESPGTQIEAIQRHWTVDTQKKGKTPFFCPRTGPGVPSREVKIQREMQSYAIKANLGVGVGASRKGESYRGSILDLAYVLSGWLLR